MSAPPVGRFAPTPSGFLHPGNLLCAMIAYLSVRSADGRFLLRIEDLDTARCPRSLVCQAVEDLLFLGFVWDEPILYQSCQQTVYESFFHRLLDSGSVYPCFCSRAQLHADLAPNRGDLPVLYPGTCRRLTAEEILVRSKLKKPAYRFRVPEEVISFSDRMTGIHHAFLPEYPGDFIIRRADGVYAYHLAVVIDDAQSGITEVVRGNDILSSTPAQICLQHQLDLPAVKYAHIPLLVDGQGNRLAKRNQAFSLRALSKYYSAQEIIGFLAYAAHLLDEPRPCSLEKLIPLFSWDRLSQNDIRLPAEFIPLS